MERLDVIYYCDPEKPNEFSKHVGNISKEDQICFPQDETPYVIEIVHEIEYLDAELKPNFFKNKVIYTVGEERDSNEVFSSVYNHKVGDPYAFHRSCQDHTMVVYTAPSGVRYARPKNPDVKVFPTPESLRDGFFFYLRTYFEQKEQEHESIAKRVADAKVYQKVISTKEKF